MNEPHDLAAAYALDALEGDEHDVYVDHLAGCGSCQQEVARLLDTAGSLAVAEAIEPPPGLRSKILENLPGAIIAPGPRRLRWAWAIAAAASVAVVVFGALWATTSGRLGVAEQVASVYAASDATIVEVDSSQVGPARFTYSTSQELGVFIGFSIPQPAPDHIYQLWLIGSDGPTPAGTFAPEADGSVSVLVDGDVRRGLVLGLTVEPSGGSRLPTGEVLLAADL
jgi:anti-sigma-K factor RskA